MEEKAISVATNDYVAPAIDVQGALMAYQAKKEFIDSVLKINVDYGTIPGSKKQALLKPGAEKLSSFFGLSPVFEDVVTVEDWEGKDHGGEPFFHYRQKCTLHRGNRIIASSDGSCNSWEKKYRYRWQNRKCPTCGQEAIIKGKEEYGGGWVCFKKKGGCGAKFKDGDESIESQAVGLIKNEDVAEQVNTILKMAQKRALVAAVLIATNASDYFTQDIEDFVDGSYAPVTDDGEIVDEPEPVKVPPMTIEMASEVTTTEGTPYTDIDTETLGYMEKSILKALSKPNITDIEREEYKMKLAAARAIKEERAK